MAQGQRGPTPTNRDIAREREDEVARLRTRERLPWKDIAAQLQADEKNCREAWKRRRARAYREAADDIDAWRGEMLATLEAVVDGLMPKALLGDSRAAEAIVKALERASKMLGLDAPTRINATVTDEMTERIKALVQELADA